MISAKVFFICIFVPLLQLARSAVLHPVFKQTWAPLDSSSSFEEVYGNEFEPFDVWRNWENCKDQHKMVVEYKGDKDYSEQINDNLLASEEEGGGLISFGNGTFTVSQQFRIPSNTCLIGESMENTTIRFDPSVMVVDHESIFYSRSSQRVSVLRLTVDGNRMKRDEDFQNPTEYAVFNFRRVNYVWFQDVQAINAVGNGFSMSGADVWSSYVVMKHCTAQNNGKHGVIMNGTNYASISHGFIVDNGDSGISIVGGSNHSLIRENHVIGNGMAYNSCGISVAKMGRKAPFGSIIANNSVINSFFAGVCIKHAENVELRNTTIGLRSEADSLCYHYDSPVGLVESQNVCSAHAGEDEHSPDDQANPQTADALPPPTADRSGRDPSCAAGIQALNVCCPAECGKCGGKGCGTRMESGACCIGKIRAVKQSCMNGRAPCVIEADDLCSTGIVGSNVCCPRQCGTCGGRGCSGRAPGKVCCISQVRNTGKSCKSFGPPCILS